MPGRKPTGRPNGRPKGRMGFTPEQITDAYQRYLAGDSPFDIAADIGCTDRTVRNWARKGGWHKELTARRKTIPNLEAEIARMASLPSTPRRANQIAQLTKALGRLKRQAPQPKARPKVRQAVSADLLKYVLSDEFGLYQYQKDFLQSEDRYRCVLKARQIGFSWIIGLAAVLGAVAGRNQLVVSASLEQSQIVLAYARQHAARLELTLDKDDTSLIVIGGSEIRALPANFRTVQGHPGDVWLDEFAWHHNPKRIWGAILPSITAVGGRVSVTSTPFVPGNQFWAIAENHRQQWNHFKRWTITIEDAMAQGMPLPGGLDELRVNFDAETWQMFYMCQWAEDGSALLPWALLHELAKQAPALKLGRLRGGVDVGRINDRTAITLSGQELDPIRGNWVDRYQVHHYEIHKGMEFAEQRQTVQALDGRFDVDQWSIDKTGLGFQLAEELQKDMPERCVGRWFSAQYKERIALNLLKLCEDRRLVLPNDPDFLANLHAVKRHANAKGIRYDAERDGSGHADLFWSTAMSLDGRARSADGGAGCGVEVL